MGTIQNKIKYKRNTTTQHHKKKTEKLAKQLPAWVKKSTQVTKLLRKQSFEGAFKTKNNIGKVLNMNRVALQRTQYANSGEGYTNSDVQIAILCAPNE
jgi:hypothetical protein